MRSSNVWSSLGSSNVGCACRKFKSLASQLGLPVKMVKMRFTRKRKQAQALLRKGAAALATLLPAAVDEHAADSTRSHTSHDDDDDEFKDDFGL